MPNVECNHISNSTGDWLLHTMGFNCFPFSSFCQFFSSSFVHLNPLYRMIECHIIPNVNMKNKTLLWKDILFIKFTFFSLWPIIKIHISPLEPETYHIIIHICAINSLHKYGTNFRSFMCFSWKWQQIAHKQNWMQSNMQEERIQSKHR